MKVYCKGITNKYKEGLVFRIYFIEIVKEKDLQNITVDELVQEITPKDW
jgi:hypothetical protein